jgi:elongation factor Tu
LSGQAEFVKNMINSPQTREHVLLARQVGVEHLVVFVNKIDVADPELVELVVLEVEELLLGFGYRGSPVVRGSALAAVEACRAQRGEPSAPVGGCRGAQPPDVEAASAGDVASGATACIRELLAALDAHVPDPERDYGSPFLMPIEDVFTIEGRGTVVTGRVQRGVLSRGAPVEVVGLVDVADAPRTVVVTGIQSFHRDRVEARAGENVGLLLRGVRRDEVVRGQVVTAPGSVQPHVAGEADLYVLDAKEGGRHTPFGTGYRPQFFFGSADVTGEIEVEAGPVLPGARARVGFRLQHAIGLEPGMRFALREGGKTIGAGLVTSIRR